MKLRIPPHLAAIVITSAFLPASGVSQTLASSAGPLTMSGTNGTSYVSFTNQLGADRDTFDEFASGDSITLTFTVGYTRVSSTNLGNTSFEFGFVGASSSLLYASLLSNSDSINGTNNSLFRSREGSLFFSNGTTQRLTGADAFSTAFMYDTNTATTESYSVSLKVTKASATNYLLDLNIGGNTFSDTVSFTAAAATDEQAITGVGFRNNNAFFTSPSLTNISVSFTAVPEPSSFALLAGSGALVAVGARRRRNAH